MRDLDHPIPAGAKNKNKVQPRAIANHTGLFPNVSAIEVCFAASLTPHRHDPISTELPDDTPSPR
jgi:hypothetical protein